MESPTRTFFHPRSGPRDPSKSQQGLRALRIASCLAVLLTACGGSPRAHRLPSGCASAKRRAVPRWPPRSNPGAVSLAGSRCAGRTASDRLRLSWCRRCGGDNTASEPGQKRLEIRMSAAGGKAVLRIVVTRNPFGQAGATERWLLRGCAGLAARATTGFTPPRMSGGRRGRAVCLQSRNMARLVHIGTTC